MAKTGKGRKRRSALAKMAPEWVRYVAATKWSREANDEYKARRLGSFGPASECRILVKDGKPCNQE